MILEVLQKGYIYKGNRIINWCPVCHTSISDAEVEHQDQDSFFWHINYPVVGEPGRFLEIATTRPETLLGDSAVAVNPEDERYKDLIGKLVHLPLTDRDIPVVADEHADMDFGTGCVKITPAHDPNDFEVGLRHGLEVITVTTDDCELTATCAVHIKEPVVLTGISLSGSYKTEFNIGDKFTSEGLVVTATYSNGTTRTVHPESITGHDTSKAGTQTVTVVYGEDSLRFNAPLFFIKLFKVLPSTYSITIKYLPLSSPTSYISTILGCLSELAELASL